MLELINQLDGFDPRGNIKVCPIIIVPTSALSEATTNAFEVPESGLIETYLII